MPTLESPNASKVTPALELRRVIRAPRAQVYDAWTKPEILKQWFGPADMYCPNASLNACEGGTYRIDMHPALDPIARAEAPEAARREATATGRYIKVIPNELLQFTWVPSWMPGEESLVTISLRDVQGGTEITLRHEQFLPESSREGYERGWTGSLDKLTARLEAN